MKKKIVEYVLLVITFIVLINLFAANTIEIQEAANYIEIDRVMVLHLRSSLYIIIMGLLIERQLITKIIKDRKVVFSPLFFVGLIVLMLGVLHVTFYMKIGVFTLHRPFPLDGIGFNMLVAPLYQGSSVQHILTLIATIIIVRGLLAKKLDDTNI